MRRLRKWWQLSRREKWLLLEALWWVGLIRLGLWLVRRAACRSGWPARQNPGRKALMWAESFGP